MFIENINKIPKDANEDLSLLQSFFLRTLAKFISVHLQILFLLIFYPVAQVKFFQTQKNWTLITWLRRRW